jgi:hypothetical protein
MNNEHELTPEREVELIRKALRAEPQWSPKFLFAVHTGAQADFRGETAPGGRFRWDLREGGAHESEAGMCFLGEYSRFFLR